ncbi:DUF6797 domain-containing protein [Thalassoroseus pseudoceratinae]|uniref:DUF6797 domain-containing protein n=1 Tax=Thalassoroseus pseudoceratinae TaxID=2713176 RepID=UPI0014237353|nr:DUF6797 domain-containing protein [Thalassoroseus pseudoceratinae]
MHSLQRSFALFLWLGFASVVSAQTLEQRLNAEATTNLAKAAMELGDAKRGAIVFHRVNVGCAKCHQVFESTPPNQTANNPSQPLGPNLSELGSRKDASVEHIVESILKPSEKIRPGFETVTVLKTDGTVLTGLKADADGSEFVRIRETTTNGITTIPRAEVDQVLESQKSIMPTGVVNTLASRQQFLDLVQYVIEIRDGGSARARELHPPAALIAFKLPEYENHVDHAGLIRNLDDDAFARGETIYNRLCINCHGNLERAGSLPTALRFGQGKFKNGSEPFTMYQTLTHGFGLMLPQTWMVPRQKYDVIHYIREKYLKRHNAEQYVSVTQPYLKSLPSGDTFGPEPVEFAPWQDMDYGRWMHNTIEVGRDKSNIAYKGIAVRLDPGPGGISRGNQWMMFDHDTMRFAAGWVHSPEQKTRFIDWQGIHFDGRHQAHPHAMGDVIFQNPTGPGWANPETNSFADTLRVQGRDGKRYGPLPKPWADYHGMYNTAVGPVFSYSVGGRRLLETVSSVPTASSDISPAMVRTLQLQPTDKPRTLLVATLPEGTVLDRTPLAQTVTIEPTDNATDTDQPEHSIHAGHFDGSQWLQVAKTFDTFNHDFTITASIKTKHDGVIVANTTPGPKWVPNGTVLFLRGGRLCYDIGWVGVVESRRKIADGQWHRVAVSWDAETELVQLFVDGQKVASRRMATKQPLKDAVLRIGFGAPNFPRQSAFEGSIRDVRFFDESLSEVAIGNLRNSKSSPIASWLTDAQTDPQKFPAKAVSNPVRKSQSANRLLAGFAGDGNGCHLEQQDERLVLVIPPSQEKRTLRVWTARPNNEKPIAEPVVSGIQNSIANATPNTALDELITKPAENPWPEVLKTTASLGEFNESGFAVDTLTAPDSNPWLARLRFSGLDFYADGDRLALCSWDGDVYEVSGLSQLQTDGTATLTWKRIAAGLFQPLGLKIVNGEIYLTCRDQLVILRDRNGDGATDFYECFNNDQQVTEHFHEFAMGLQRDANGNFYYAKSARHALEAVVPHHGTLLKVTPDGNATEILAFGFRAANGVCMNPDGSFVVTDQEGHWNPKNRINWVVEGGFYGNMYGYHDVTDSSDSAMQPPLCWITNSFDRSPAELLWSGANQWGNLRNTLLNLSYGYGKVFVVPHEHLDETGGVQGAMCQLPIDQFPTGTMRGRFHPGDGQLYVCGLFAWGSSQQMREGGLYRIRYSGSGAIMPIKVQTKPKTLSITFSDALAADVVSELERFQFQTWDLKRTKNYGSKHYNEQNREITSAVLSADRKTITLTIPELAPTWCYELQCRLRTPNGQTVSRTMHGTIHDVR